MIGHQRQKNLKSLGNQKDYGQWLVSTETRDHEFMVFRNYDEGNYVLIKKVVRDMLVSAKAGLKMICRGQGCGPSGRAPT
jgi:hypothetical protein